MDSIHVHVLAVEDMLSSSSEFVSGAVIERRCSSWLDPRHRLLVNNLEREGRLGKIKFRTIDATSSLICRKHVTVIVL